MMEIAATNVIASREPEQGPTATSTAHSNVNVLFCKIRRDLVGVAYRFLLYFVGSH